MVLNSKIMLVRQTYGIDEIEDWCEITPEQILALDGIGNVTLDHIRLLLSSHGLMLKGDRKPYCLAENLHEVKVETQISDDDEFEVCPFRIVVDSAEQKPFEFDHLKMDMDQDGRPVVVETVTRSLGRYPDSLGDYSIDGLVGKVHVERKSVQDLQQTLLGFGDGGSRERFKQELANLDQVDAAVVVVEGLFTDFLAVNDYQTRKLGIKQVRKILHRSIISIDMEYRTSIRFCMSRQHAEVYTFQFLRKYWDFHIKRLRNVERMLSKI